MVMLAFSSFTGDVFAQKKNINNDVYKNWERLGRYNTSDDGKWVWFEINKGTTIDRTLILVDVGKKQQLKLTKRLNGDVFFSENNKVLACQLRGDSLLLFNLLKNTTEYLSNARLLRIIKYKNSQAILFIKGEKLIMQDVLSGIQKSYGRPIGRLLFSSNETTMAFCDKEKLYWIDLLLGDTILTRPRNLGNLALDKSGRRLAWSSGQNLYLYNYQKGDVEKKCINISKINRVCKDLELAETENELIFSLNGKCLYLKLRKAIVRTETDSTLVKRRVEIWHYKDRFWKNNQNLLNREMFLSVINIDNPDSLIQLEDQERQVTGSVNHDNFTIVKNVTNTTEAFFRSEEIPRYWLKSIHTGVSKEFLPNMMRNEAEIIPQLTPQERFIIWKFKESIFSYEIASGVVKNITSNVHNPVFDTDRDNKLKSKGYTIEGLDPMGNFVIVGDKYDLYKIDLLGIRSPLSLTRGYGKKNKIKFLLARSFDQSRIRDNAYLLRAFNTETKANGFALIDINNKSPFRILNLDHCLYSWPGNMDGPPEIMRARDINLFLVTKQTESMSPNLFWTKDFKSFEPVSNVHPESEYNWMTSELIKYPMEGGELGEAILYKPENFDSRRKYPIIFHYYQKNSDFIHLFHNPGLSRGELNIPWYVSNDYLVCIPDILNNEPGQIVKRTVNSVVSAVAYLKKHPWLDLGKMGIQGHSFGGYETNILVSNTNIFAAAQSSAAPSDQIMGYGRGGDYGYSFYEMGQFNFQVSPWENQSQYLTNSPILQANKIITPLLLQHNKDDDAVTFAHGEEMFVALRRLAKPVWLLQYDGESHSLDNRDSALDFTERQQQFFDHYLKGLPAPSWMLRVISEKEKVIKTELSLDNSNHMP